MKEGSPRNVRNGDTNLLRRVMKSNEEVSILSERIEKYRGDPTFVVLPALPQRGSGNEGIVGRE